MLFWGIAGLLTLICVILVIWPLLRQKEVLETNVDYNLKVYKDQLSEVDKDFQIGRVDSKELDAIKTEIQRRILTENVEDSPSLDEGILTFSNAVKEKIAFKPMSNDSNVFKSELLSNL